MFFFNRESFCTSTKSTCGSVIHRTIKDPPDRPTIFTGWESCIYNISLQTKAYQERSTVRLFLDLYVHSFLHERVYDMIQIDLSQILWYIELLQKKNSTNKTAFKGWPFALYKTRFHILFKFWIKRQRNTSFFHNQILFCLSEICSHQLCQT